MSTTKSRPFRFGTGAFHHIRSRTQFINLARKIEDMGYILILRLLITDDRKAGVEALAKDTGMTSEEVLDNVHILVGTVDQIVEDLQMRREQFGISYITANEHYIDDLAPIVARLAGT